MSFFLASLPGVVVVCSGLAAIHYFPGTLPAWGSLARCAPAGGGRVLRAQMTPLGYLAIGWYLLPIQPGTKRPLDGQGLKHATLDEDKIDEWCSREADFAVACEQSGIVVLDVDPRNGGNTTWIDLLARYGPLPDHPVQRTRGGGDHHVFAAPGGACVGKLGPGVDVKYRGYVLVAPTTGYSWDVEPSLPLPHLPESWLEAIKKEKPQRTAPTMKSTPGGGTAYGVKALEQECAGVASEPEGDRNNRLNVAAVKLASLAAGGELDGESAQRDLLNAALSAGLPKHEAVATIASGWNAGRETPRRAPEPQHKPGGGARPALALVHSATPAPVPPEESAPDGELAYGKVLRGEVPGPEDWRNGLTVRTLASGEVVIERTAGNLALLLGHEPGWEGCLKWDELAYAASWVKAPPAIPGLATPTGRLRDEHAAWVQQAGRREWGVMWSKDATQDAMAMTAQGNSHHPVREYLEGLEWDGVPRIGTWLQNYFGAEATECPVGRWWLISAVARAMRPGCQTDHVLVLQGAQGVGKSSGVEIMGGAWYSNALANLRDKDSAQSLQGVWLMEIGELDALRGRAATEVKDFISRRTDHYRPSYGHFFVDRPRACVFAGTTNEHEFLFDASGGRRFWPVRVKFLRREDLTRDRDQIWAEATVAYEDGERWWPVGQDEAEQLAYAAEQRYSVDPWEEHLAHFWLPQQRGDSFKMIDALNAVGVEKGRQTPGDSRRMGAILRRSGWQVFNSHRDGKKWREKTP